MRKPQLVVLTLSLAVSAVALRAQTQSQPAANGYLLPPKVIVDLLDAPPPPTAELSPARDVIVLLERTAMPTIAELSQPMLRLAGVRINPRTNGPHRSNNRYRNLTLKAVVDGAERKVTLPTSPVIGWIGFSPDGGRFAFTNTKDNGMELWVGATATGQAKAVTAPQLNGALVRQSCTWIGQGASLLCSFVPANRGAMPGTPIGPNIQENRGTVQPQATVQDMLTSRQDEVVFEYLVTSQLEVVDAAGGQRSPIGKPGMFTDFDMSPDSHYVLAARITQPFSWLVRYDDFPTAVEVIDRKGAVVKAIADLPLANEVPQGGVLPGPRDWRWNPIEPATVTWAEALDGGNPKAKVPFRDKVMTLAAPFSATPTEIAKTEWRLTNITWTTAGVGWLTESDRPTRSTRTSVIDKPGAAPRVLWQRSTEDSYGNPGTPLRKAGASSADPIVQLADNVYMTGVGSSPDGDRPFLDRMNVRTGAKERLFQTEIGSYEPVLGLLSDDGSRFVSRHENRTTPPNAFVRGREAGSRRAMSSYQDPAMALQGVKSQMVTYTRADGVQLRMTVHTPPGWTPDKGRLPALLWAYPQEFTDPRLAGQVTGSPYRFTSPGWSTLHMLFLTQGYAILDDPKMPIVGPGETANDTYVQQLVSSAQAAVDKAVEMGIVDRDRVIAGGHSYGAFMTANLLAHSDIFRAGIARSGAYNRTLTPFGFQNERRTFWEVPQLYGQMSPFFYADKIKEPILLIHGEADDNAGTYPIQSDRFYRALSGHGATVRYVTLPYEAHGYAARESVLHTVAEMLNWANEWVKDAKPRMTTSQQR
jgi:dipeptidyl aminopeptidase/acylaminoacyl peptidase